MAGGNFKDEKFKSSSPHLELSNIFSVDPTLWLAKYWALGAEIMFSAGKASLAVARSGRG